MANLTISEIVQKTRRCKIDTLIPLTKVISAEDKELYCKNDSFVGYTLEEFKNKFPSVNPNNIFYRHVANYCQVIYYDKHKLIFTLLPIDKDHLLCPIEEENKLLDSVIKKYEQLFFDGDFKALLRCCDRAIALDVLLDALKNGLTITDCYDLFIPAYRGADYGFADIDKDIFQKIISSKTEEAIIKTSKKLSIFPDTITIYRGEGDKSTPKGYSWTPDINVANFFATRLSQDNSKILVAKVKKEHIIEYITAGFESEFLIDPENIIHQKEIELPSTKNKKIQNLVEKSLDTYFKYKDMLNKLVFEHDTKGHGKEHTLRVLFLSILLATHHNISRENLELLCNAALYHDISRDNDEEDIFHGENSYEIYKINNKQNKIIEFLMSYHCKNDEYATRKLKKAKFNNKKEVLQLFCILKDADALDRVRFGILDLDMNYLRLEVSKTLTLVSYETLKFLRL